MTEEQIEMIATEVLRRLKKRVLVLLTNARGYRTEIYARLRMQQEATFSFLLAEDAAAAHCAQRWGRLGPVLSYSPQRLEELSGFDALLLPFLDFSTLGRMANGVIDNSITEITAQALLRGMTVLAFDYNCNPSSELNSVIGCQQNNGYSRLFQQHLASVAKMGVRFISVNEMGPLLSVAPKQVTAQTQAITWGKTLLQARQGDMPPACEVAANRYITLNDLLEQRVTHLTPEMKLTALAQEYIKENRQQNENRQKGKER